MDEAAERIREAARRLDGIAQYMSPPTDRNAERVADWLRQGLTTDPEHRGGYEEAAAWLLDGRER